MKLLRNKSRFFFCSEVWKYPKHAYTDGAGRTIIYLPPSWNENRARQMAMASPPSSRATLCAHPRKRRKGGNSDARMEWNGIMERNGMGIIRGRAPIDPSHL